MESITLRIPPIQSQSVSDTVETRQRCPYGLVQAITSEQTSAGPQALQYTDLCGRDSSGAVGLPARVRRNFEGPVQSGPIQGRAGRTARRGMLPVQAVASPRSTYSRNKAGRRSITRFAVVGMCAFGFRLGFGHVRTSFSLAVPLRAFAVVDIAGGI